MEVKYLSTEYYDSLEIEYEQSNNKYHSFDRMNVPVGLYVYFYCRARLHIIQMVLAIR